MKRTPIIFPRKRKASKTISNQEVIATAGLTGLLALALNVWRRNDPRPAVATKRQTEHERFLSLSFSLPRGPVRRRAQGGIT